MSASPGRTPAVELRPARPEEAARLTAIAHAAKASWGYPVAWMELWRDELTFDAESMRDRWVVVAASDGVPIGVAALTADPGEPELEHLWVDPDAAGRGVGRALVAAARKEARQRGARRLRVVSDPNAEGFYLALGARRIGHVDGRPPGRRLPLLVLGA